MLVWYILSKLRIVMKNSPLLRFKLVFDAKDKVEDIRKTQEKVKS